MLHNSASQQPGGAQTTSGSGGGVQEDAMLAISALIEKLGSTFSKYMGAFKPYLIQTLKNTAEYQVCESEVWKLCENRSFLWKSLVKLHSWVWCSEPANRS